MPAYSVQAYSILWYDMTIRIATGSIQEHDLQHTPKHSVQANQSTVYCDVTWLSEYSNWQRASPPSYNIQCTVRVQQLAAYNNMTTCIHLRTVYTPEYSELPAYSNATTRVQQSAAYNDVIASVERHDEMRLPKSSNRQHTTTWPAVHASVQRTYQPACQPASVQRYDATWRDAVQLPKLSRWQHTTWLADMPVCSLLICLAITVRIRKAP